MLNNLTGLRFYAALWVFLYHFFPVYTSIKEIPFFEIGYLGVDIFFVLSGFILTYVYYKTFFINKITWQDYWHFIVKRFAKIYPLHFILTIIFIPLLYVAKYLFHQNSLKVDFDALLQNFLLIHSWNTTEKLSWNYPSWSISAEWFAYLFLFAPIAFFYKKSRLIYYTLSCLVIAFFVFYWIQIPGFTMDKYTMNGLPRIILEFVIGTLIGISRVKYSLNRLQSSFVFIFSLLFLLASYYFNLLFQQLCVFGFTGIILALSYPTYFDKAFGSRRLIYLGNISYAFYLTQFLALIIYEQLFNFFFGKFFGFSCIFIIQFVVAFSINFIFAAIAYKYFEEPVRLIIVKKMIKIKK